MSQVSPRRMDRQHLGTATGEPFQPVRLYYTIPGKPFVTRLLARLGCMDEDRAGGRWVWLYEAEAEGLTFGRPRADLPDEAHPVVIGALRFPGSEQMTLEVRSCARAIEAARFFGPVLGPSVVLRRGRVVNRFFDVAEMVDGLEGLDRMLDRDVTASDASGAEERLRRLLAGAKTPAEAFEALRNDREDLPLVEDFPIDPEEATLAFEHLALTLRLRTLRAYEHWKGNTGVILMDLVEQLVREMPEAQPSAATMKRSTRPRVKTGRRRR